jgi:hypothetical protein
MTFTKETQQVKEMKEPQKYESKPLDNRVQTGLSITSGNYLNLQTS